jgi:putative lipase involved disintegration of autophagic bodies
MTSESMIARCPCCGQDFPTCPCVLDDVRMPDARCHTHHRLVYRVVQVQGHPEMIPPARSPSQEESD